jgi:chromate reductase, NAD(P)H dehydrogenase (quinone)
VFPVHDPGRIERLRRREGPYACPDITLMKPSTYHPVRILAISGSLRSGSSNTLLLQAASSLAPPGVEITMYEGIDRLPFFNPDLDGDVVPLEVEGFRSALRSANGLLISSPEYAHGVPGVMKNALDWLVGSTQGEIVEKPVAVINASPYATIAQASLIETLRVMSARVVADVGLSLSLKSRAFDANTLRAEPDVVRVVSAALSALTAAITEVRE